MRTGQKQSHRSGRRIVLVSLLCVTLLGGCFACASLDSPPTPPTPVGYAHFEPAIVSALGEWHDALETEYVMTLFGRIEGLVVVVEGFDATESLASTATTASARGYHNNARVVGVVHNHPDGNCFPSPQDLAMLEGVRQYRIMAVTCGDGKIGYVVKGHPRYQVVPGR